MNKPEPLKDKGSYFIGHGLISTPNEDSSSYKVYCDDDIKNAVDWLYSKRLGKKNIALGLDGKQMLVFYEEDFNKAFEDVMKKEQGKLVYSYDLGIPIEEQK